MAPPQPELPAGLEALGAARCARPGAPARPASAADAPRRRRPRAAPARRGGESDADRPGRQALDPRDAVAPVGVGRRGEASQRERALPASAPRRLQPAASVLMRRTARVCRSGPSRAGRSRPAGPRSEDATRAVFDEATCSRCGSYTSSSVSSVSGDHGRDRLQGDGTATVVRDAAQTRRSISSSPFSSIPRRPRESRAGPRRWSSAPRPRPGRGSSQQAAGDGGSTAALGEGAGG